jgi:hypothetical protein
MTTDRLREEYLQWLYPQLRDVHSTPGTYLDLAQLMFDKPFQWTVDHDDNRLVDGLDLRTEFRHLTNRSIAQMEQLPPCSFLEVLIGLSRRLEFVAGGEAPGWAWQLITNLGLHKLSDPLTRRRAHKVDEIMETAIWRRYDPDGQGGFFPLAWPEGDQTRVELWYQLNAYAVELNPIH